MSRRQPQRRPRAPERERRLTRTGGERPRGARAVDPARADGCRVMRVEAEHRFAIPVERGFAFITDTSNWPKFWRYVRLEEGSSWGAAGDTARLVTRLLGRERLLTMRIATFE